MVTNSYLLLIVHMMACAQVGRNWKQRHWLTCWEAINRCPKRALLASSRTGSGTAPQSLCISMWILTVHMQVLFSMKKKKKPRISKPSNKVEATWRATVRTPAVIAEHITQASLCLFWGKQDLPFYHQWKKKKKTGVLEHLITTVFLAYPFSVWGWKMYLGIPNMPLCWGHTIPEADSWLGTFELTGLWLLKVWLQVWRRRELASSLPVNLRICFPGATRACGTEATYIQGRSSSLYCQWHQCSQITPASPSTRGTGKKFSPDPKKHGLF